jgi:hypothetical protein
MLLSLSEIKAKKLFETEHVKVLSVDSFAKIRGPETTKLPWLNTLAFPMIPNHEDIILVYKGDFLHHFWDGIDGNIVNELWEECSGFVNYNFKSKFKTVSANKTSPLSINAFFFIAKYEDEHYLFLSKRQSMTAFPLKIEENGDNVTIKTECGSSEGTHVYTINRFEQIKFSSLEKAYKALSNDKYRMSEDYFVFLSNATNNTKETRSRPLPLRQMTTDEMLNHFACQNSRMRKGTKVETFTNCITNVPCESQIADKKRFIIRIHTTNNNSRLAYTKYLPLNVILHHANKLKVISSETATGHIDLIVESTTVNTSDFINFLFSFLEENKNRHIEIKALSIDSISKLAQNFFE